MNSQGLKLWRHNLLPLQISKVAREVRMHQRERSHHDSIVQHLYRYVDVFACMCVSVAKYISSYNNDDGGNGNRYGNGNGNGKKR